MTKIVAIGVAIVACAGLGAGGYFLYRHFKKKEKEEEPVVIASIEYDPKKFEKKDIPKEKVAKAVRNYEKKRQPDENFEAYLASMESPEEDDSDEEDDILEPPEEIDDKEEANKEPYQITSGEFYNSRKYYDKISLSYFAEDRILADERDKVIHATRRMVGDIWDMFDKEDHPDVIYIRNERIEVDYEISYVDGRFE